MAELVPIIDRWGAGKEPQAWLFAAPGGGPLRESNWKRSVGWRAAKVTAGLPDVRVHDLRHSFAVQALIRWYRDGADVQSCLPKLALYMGHVSIESSAYYLHWVPTLQRLASQRFEQHFGHLIPGEAR